MAPNGRSSKESLTECCRHQGMTSFYDFYEVLGNNWIDDNEYGRL